MSAEILYTADGTAYGTYDPDVHPHALVTRFILGSTIVCLSKWHTYGMYRAVREQEAEARELEALDEAAFWEQHLNRAQTVYSFTHLAETGQDNPIPAAFRCLHAL